MSSCLKTASQCSNMFSVLLNSDDTGNFSSTVIEICGVKMAFHCKSDPENSENVKKYRQTVFLVIRH